MRKGKDLQHLMAFVTFAVGAVMGCFWSLNSWNGTIYVYVEDSRNPAAIHKGMDISNLKGSDLRIASRDRLLLDAKVFRKNGATAIELGHFITKTDNGNKQFACRTYQRIRLTYQAEGMAESGDVPQMTVEGPCVMSADINRIAPLWIPESRIRANKPHDFQIDYEEQDVQMSFRFSNMGSEWPNLWTLRSAMLFDPDDANAKLEFTPQDVVQRKPKQLNLMWDGGGRTPAKFDP